MIIIELGVLNKHCYDNQPYYQSVWGGKGESRGGGWGGGGITAEDV